MKTEGVAKSAQQKELEAESIAYTVMFHYHMDTSGCSIPYLASWSGRGGEKFPGDIHYESVGQALFL